MPSILSSETSRISIVTIAGIGLVSAASAFALWYRKKYLDNLPPKKWRKVGEVIDLIIYPIKSCGPIKVSEIDCTKLGPVDGYLRDRIFMIATKNGDITFGLKHPKMVLVQPIIEKNSAIMKLSAPKMDDISINIEQLYGKTPSTYKFWNKNIKCIDCGDQIANWISQFILGEENGLRLVLYPNNDENIFEASYMLFNENSLNDLNTRLDNSAETLRFRPNIVIRGDGALAYDEDYWKWIKIGNTSDVIFRNVDPCIRCNVINIDPATGMRSPDNNPLKTLTAYRNPPVLGVYLGLKSIEGKISLGDAVFVEA